MPPQPPIARHRFPLRGAAAMVLVLVALAGLLAAGLRAASSWAEEQSDPTRSQAESIGFRLANARTVDANELAHIAQGQGAEILEVQDVSPCEVAGTELECSSLLIRLEASEPGMFAGSTPTHVETCWRYRIANSSDDPHPRRVDCPEGAVALELAPLPPPPNLPDGIQDQLHATLTGLAQAGTLDEASVRAAVEAIAGGPPAYVDVATVEGIVGAVVGLSGEGKCVAGRVVDGATVEVWSVPHVLAQPGEGGCGAGVAATGASARPPH